MNIFVADNILHMASVTSQPSPPSGSCSVVNSELKRFGEKTSIRGIPRAVKSSDMILTVTWWFAVIVCGLLLLYQLSSIFIGYFTYDYTTVIKTDNAPSVSI